MSEKIRHYIYQDKYFWTLEEEEKANEIEREYFLEMKGLTEDDLIGDDYKTRALRKQFEQDFLEYQGETEHDSYNDEKEGNLAALDGSGNGMIIAIADLGLWFGNRTGYREIGYNISDIMQGYGCDYAEYFVEDSDIDSDGMDVKYTGVHHDGTNHLVFRALKDEVETDGLDNIIFDSNRENNEDRVTDWLRGNTESIAPLICNLYGWKSEKAA